MGMSGKSRSLRFKAKRERRTKLHEFKRAYKQASTAERTVIVEKAYKIAPYLNVEKYLKDN
jgi:hypothetical protein